jgi:two-component system, OmpR family, sensor histidine kinase KdpD
MKRAWATRVRPAAATGAEIVVAVAAATGGIAALQSTAPASGLGVLYLLSVLVIAIRRGQLAALITAVLSMLALNYLFIPPRHRLTIAHSQDFVELAVLLIVAVVVGRLAAAGRQRAAEAESRAGLAAAREREAKLVAEAASAILAGQSIDTQLGSIGKRIAAATGASRARLALESVPGPWADEVALPLRAHTRTAWLYVTRDTSWEHADLERIAEPLGRLIDVAVERARVAERAAEAEASRRAEVARTAVLHAISHDLRSPLTAITTAGSALRGATITDAERMELIEVIEGEGARLAKLVDDLLDLSKIQAGAVAPQADWCDLHDVVGSAAAQLRTEHPLEFALPVDLPLVRADAAQLERVFSNLIQNAVKFSPPAVPVRISAGVGSGKVTVRVRDQGRGIASQHRPHVFEPFYRGRGDGGSGSGLGLAICRGFVEANGGQIILQSPAGGGTSFAVSFPLVAQPERVV